MSFSASAFPEVATAWRFWTCARLASYGQETPMPAPSHRIHTDYHTVPSASAATWPLLERRRLWCPVPMALKPVVWNSAGGCQMNELVAGVCGVTVSDGAALGSLGSPFFGDAAGGALASSFFGGASLGALAFSLLGGYGVPCVLLFRSPSSSRGSWIVICGTAPSPQHPLVVRSVCFECAS